jgi:MFS family permease
MAPPDTGDSGAATIYGMATDGGPAGAGSLRLLAANRPFRLLWSARAVSFLGDSLSLVALMLHVAETTGQALAVAWLLLAGDFAPALLSPLTGTVADRLERRRVMVGCELLQGALVVVIALWLPALPLLLVLVGLRAVAGQVFQPASRAAVPAVVPERDLERANAAVGVATNGGEALGPLVAALLLPVLEVRGVLLVDAASFLVSAALLALLPPLAGPGAGARARPASFLADAGAGLRYLRGQPILRAVVGGYVAVVACTGIDDVALVFLATDTFGAGGSAVGLLLAAVGIGLLAGYALLARTGGRAPINRGTAPIHRGATPAVPRTPPAAALLLAGFAVSSAGNLLTGLAWAVAAAFAVQAARGLGIAAMDVAATTLVQRVAPPGLQGRVFGSLYGGIGVAAALSYLLGGLLLDRTTPRVAFVAAGAAGLLATGATALALRRVGN